MELILYHKKHGQDVVFARGTQHVDIMDISLVLAAATRPYQVKQVLLAIEKLEVEHATEK
ncbi:MAG: hypothetical protein PHN75_03870 [Syntrophales bacterium]|nr:hypothetical protein [Syntrophales bacterium]